jgi:hypothetical protein
MPASWRADDTRDRCEAELEYWPGQWKTSIDCATQDEVAELRPFGPGQRATYRAGGTSATAVNRSPGAALAVAPSK